MPVPASPNADPLVMHLRATRKLARYLLQNDADAEDVVQEAYARALRYGRREPAGDGRGWMLSIVRNVGYDWIRRRRRFDSGGKAEDPDQVQTGEPSPETILLAKQNAESVRKSLELLPTNQRKVVILRDLEQLSYKEIAARAGIPLGTVMSRLTRGRANLRALLTTPRHITPSRSQYSERRPTNA